MFETQTDPDVHLEIVVVVRLGDPERRMPHPPHQFERGNAEISTSALRGDAGAVEVHVRPREGGKNTSRSRPEGLGGPCGSRNRAPGTRSTGRLRRKCMETRASASRRGVEKTRSANRTSRVTPRSNALARRGPSAPATTLRPSIASVIATSRIAARRLTSCTTPPRGRVRRGFLRRPEELRERQGRADASVRRRGRGRRGGGPKRAGGRRGGGSTSLGPRG